jgi:hypothetical protein
MSLQGEFAFEYDLLRRTAVEILPVDEQITSDAGLLPIREFDERLGWTAGFAAQVHDARASHRHAIVGMLRQRVSGTWPTPRWVAVKCEANAQGTNRRAVYEEMPRQIGPAREYRRQAPTTNMPIAARARIATRNSSAS